MKIHISLHRNIENFPSTCKILERASPCIFWQHRGLTRSENVTIHIRLFQALQYVWVPFFPSMPTWNSDLSILKSRAKAQILVHFTLFVSGKVVDCKKGKNFLPILGCERKAHSMRCYRVFQVNCLIKNRFITKWFFFRLQFCMQKTRGGKWFVLL